MIPVLGRVARIPVLPAAILALVINARALAQTRPAAENCAIYKDKPVTVTLAADKRLLPFGKRYKLRLSSGGRQLSEIPVGSLASQRAAQLTYDAELVFDNAVLYKVGLTLHDANQLTLTLPPPPLGRLWYPARSSTPTPNGYSRLSLVQAASASPGSDMELLPGDYDLAGPADAPRARVAVSARPGTPDLMLDISVERRAPAQPGRVWYRIPKEVPKGFSALKVARYDGAPATPDSDVEIVPGQKYEAQGENRAPLMVRGSDKPGVVEILEPKPSFLRRWGPTLVGAALTAAAASVVALERSWASGDEQSALTSCAQTPVTQQCVADAESASRHRGRADMATVMMGVLAAATVAVAIYF